MGKWVLITSLLLLYKQINKEKKLSTSKPKPIQSLYWADCSVTRHKGKTLSSMTLSPRGRRSALQETDNLRMTAREQATLYAVTGALGT